MKKRFFDSGLYSLISSRQYLGLYCFNFWQEIFPLMGKLVLFESHFSAFSAIHATEILQASMGLSNIPKLQTSRRHYGPLFVPSKWRKKLDFQIKKRYQLKVLWIVSDSILKHKQSEVGITSEWSAAYLVNCKGFIKRFVIAWS